MSVKIGTSDITFKVGSADCTVYLGSTLVYNPTPTPHDYSLDYLTFKATEDGTFSFSGNSIDYSLDNGTTWTTLASNTDSPTVASGNTILWKATGLTPTSSSGIGRFSSTGRFTVEGNAMSLYYGDDFTGQTDLTGKDYAFYVLFSGCTALTSAENLVLLATTLASSCYDNMFRNCSGLTTPPILSATTLASSCYQSMFNGCTSLTTAPSLPAIDLPKNCYKGMFQGCTSLTKAPELHASVVGDGSYYYMFRNCSSLSEITCLATSFVNGYSTSGWVNGVAASGTFTKAASMNDWSSGASGIPNGWTVVNYGGSNLEGNNDTPPELGATADAEYYFDNFRITRI